MTTINLKYSQAVVDGMNNAQGVLALNSDLGSLVDMFAETGYGIDEDLSYTSYSLDGSTLRINFTGGATMVYGGVQMANPNAARGMASATTNELLVPGVVSYSAAGKFNYDYVMDGPEPSLTPSAQGSTLNTFRIATLLPASSPDYDPLVGNVRLTMTGALAITEQGVTGTISSVTAAADKFVLSSRIDGDFKVSVDLSAASQGLAQGKVEGTLTAYRTAFHDGSYLDVFGMQTLVSTSETVGDTLLDASAEDDEINIEMPGRLYEDMVVEAGGGNDVLVLAGGGGRLHADGGAGNDLVTLLGGSHRVDGGAGHDVVKLAMSRADATIKAGTAASTFSVSDKAGAVNQLVNVERIVFSDATLALDIDGNAGQAYRLYQAAFNRTPDSKGLGFWIHAMDHGVSLTGVADNFIVSAEFNATYSPFLTNQQLVTRFYENILHRAPETAGLDYWSGLLDRDAATRAQVLAAISDSGENKVGLVGVIGNGFTYTPYGEG